MEPNTEKQEEYAMSFDAFKKALGPAALKYSDAQIEDMRRICDQFADGFFNDWLSEKRAHNVNSDHDLLIENN